MSRPVPSWRPGPRHGVAASRVAVPSDWGRRWPQCAAPGEVPGPGWADFLAWRLPAVNRLQWQARLAAGEVLDAQGQPLPLQGLAQAGALCWYWREVPDELDLPVRHQVLFEDAQLLVVDKPHFLPMAPKGRHARETLLARLQAERGEPSLTPLHRLDAETAGVVLLGRRPADRAAYQNLFRSRAVHKTYEAVAAVPPGPAAHWPAGHTREALHHLAPGERFPLMAAWPQRPPNSQAQITLLARREGRALFRLAPSTGRTHQLRVQMLALGWPLLGDRLYPTLWPEAAPGAPVDLRRPLQLLARAIAFTDPVSGQARCFESRRTLQAWEDPAGWAGDADGA
ncbi:pseudouridine synthase [Ideonella livida]|uniref:Pseudouridine synthase n=1 Tax=Ideonella livida TaxID=2707176 RepID=A0A7C9PIY1_9BURK|nr:pseudouridine synthase [Ideonella livida]NDY93175.1 pseudouridine synthase [Ideonella livida]